ncbi:tetratricopeptide repeat protein [Streptomyces alkaliterrae]|uniref:Tetratricopeptide repeat protein n=1 Tax=Streptomyces alkaliterrae TaxID=2213162 RepID=A0A5P0YVQ2_9ACTN|nr:tetratricopeptide repeat protein [Streptomyces alkaliterrae]MBB1256242.1 tetratricopeptide repeat protein [Streptomyces alkaliterrae]MBB1261203.1 tetratricopeptide repeat protein [Streptomyces alkaliterrae]MQS04373.1 tetratricopeptide repeat protein [Streptomyces alkaliterrae]
MAKPAPNKDLERLYRESGWTLRQFAQAVNRVGTEQGTPLRYREPSVHQWLQGHKPREQVQPVVLEALSRKLSRPISHREAGFSSHEGQPNTSSSTVGGLVDLGSHDMSPSRRAVLGASLFSVAMTIPNWPDVVGRMEAAQTSTSLRIGSSEVDTVAAMTERLSELDDEFGGRHARPMAAAFLVNTVAPYLKADARETVRKDMMGAAAFLCYLAGWMAVDEGLHGLAQKYYVKGLELAGASGDHSTYCHILRGMSVQAADLGHGNPAVRFADAAAAVAPGAEHRMRAFLTGQQAHAYAVLGNRREAYRFLQESTSALEKAESQTHTFGGYAPATLAYHESQVRHELGDTEGSIKSLESHFRLRTRDNDSRRSGIRFTAMLAERQLKLGHLEAACASWSQVLDDYPTVKSGRVDRSIATMRNSLRPHLRNSRARDLHERARTAMPAHLST